MSTRISSSLTYIGPTILQLFLHIYKIAQSLQYSIVYTEIDVKDTDTDGMFHVQGKNKTHVVDFGVVSGEPTCTCKDWLAHQISCKHFFGVFRLRPEWGWEKLPHSYLQSPYLTLDDKAITEYVKSISTSPAKSCQHDLCEGPSSPAPSTPPDHTSEVKLSELPRKVGNSGCTY